MLFEDYHLFEFRIGERRYAVPDPEWDLGRETYAARNVRIGALIERGVAAFAYTYDFGDDWRHTITIEGVDDANPDLEYPRFIEGERRAPPEDVGGFPGFENFLEAMAKPRHSDHRQVMQWYGGRFDPDDIQRDAVEKRIAKLVRRRALGKAGFIKSKNPQS
jgi:hypothetical protein